jgi:hypothetical protein
LLLGVADEYKAYPAEALGAVLVDLKRASAHTLLLITPREGGQPLLENISGQLSLAAGRGPATTVRELSLNFDKFASDGIVEVADKGSGLAKAQGTARVNLAAQIAEAKRASAEFRLQK